MCRVMAYSRSPEYHFGALLHRMSPSCVTICCREYSSFTGPIALNPHYELIANALGDLTNPGTVSPIRATSGNFAPLLAIVPYAPCHIAAIAGCARTRRRSSSRLLGSGRHVGGRDELSSKPDVVRETLRSTIAVMLASHPQDSKAPGRFRFRRRLLSFARTGCC